MATKKAPAKKTAAAKKPAKTPRINKPAVTATPVKIIVEVVIKNETSIPVSTGSNVLNLMAPQPGNCPANKFTYSFDKKDAKIHSLIVEGFQLNSPPATGNFTTCVNDINIPPQIRVTVFGTETLPGGRASLALKFRGKDVFSPDRELDKMPNGNLGFSELVKLPL